MAVSVDLLLYTAGDPDPLTVCLSALVYM